MKIAHTLAAATLTAGLALTGSASLAASPHQPTAPTSVTTGTHAPRVLLAGAVQRPRLLDARSLARLPQRSVTTTFTAQGRPTTRTFTGPLLLDVVRTAEPRFDASRSNDALAFAIRVGATDGYRAVVAWGEIDPGFAGTQVLLATTEDGVRLERPRLVVPGDARGGRYVTDVSSIAVLDLGGR